MYMKEFVTSVYPIKELVRNVLSNPLVTVMKRDDLPYDDIRLVDGELQKVIFINDEEEFIPVLELLSYSEEDIRKLGDEQMRQVYEAYMENVDVEDMELANLIEASKRYRAKQREKKELRDRCTL